MKRTRMVRRLTRVTKTKNPEAGTCAVPLDVPFDLNNRFLINLTIGSLTAKGVWKSPGNCDLVG
jgi:hypothetical protein